MAQDTIAVQERLRLVLGEFVDLDVDDDGDAFIAHESLRAYVGVQAYNGEHTCLTVFTVVGAGLPSTPALFRWIAVKGAQFLFGQLTAVVREDAKVNVNFSHSLLIDDLTDEQLRATVLPVVFTAGDLHLEAHSLFSEA
jgi:hypothetical protein